MAARRLKLTKVAIVTALWAVLGAGAFAQTAGAATGQGVSPAKTAKALPPTLAAVLPELKSKSHIPVLLPSTLPKPFADAGHALLDEASDAKYAIALYYELGAGDSAFAAMFAAEAGNDSSPDIPNLSVVKLAHGLQGYFREVSCGGSCAPANLWWQQDGVVYQIQLKLPSTARVIDQQRAITAVANSAILAGRR